MTTKALQWGILAALSLSGAFGLGCNFDSYTQTPASMLGSPLAGRPECPHDWDFKRGQMPLAGQAINVPEFHDCQRFIEYTGDSAHYQALYAIFATAELNALDTMTTDSVRAAAEIFAEGKYQALGIVAPYSCLYLFRNGPPPDTTWRAIMAPVAGAQVDCRKRVDPDTMPGKKELDVQVTRVPSFGGQDYPPVARWDWDRVHKKQYIGIKCGTAWCEVGDIGFTPGPGFSDPGGLSQKLRRTRLIKGWYDQQFLATVSAAGKTTPSRIRGTIFPDSGLGDYDTLGVFKRVHPGHWVAVAQVLLEAPATLTPEDVAVIKQYKDSLNFDATVAGGTLNTISLCHGTKSDCIPLGSVSTVGPCDGDEMWWGQIESTHGPTDRMYRCVVRRAHDHLEFRVPGTARWRWLASDEVTWKRCDNGCCELH